MKDRAGRKEEEEEVIDNRSRTADKTLVVGRTLARDVVARSELGHY